MMDFILNPKTVGDGLCGADDNDDEPAKLKPEAKLSRRISIAACPTSDSISSVSTETSSRTIQLLHQQTKTNEATAEQCHEGNMSISSEDLGLIRHLVGRLFIDYKHVSEFRVLGGHMKLLKKDRQGSSIQQYVASGCLPISAETLIGLNLDNCYRYEWDESCVELRPLSAQVEEPFSECLYAVAKYPSPLSKRDYVFRRRVVQHGHCVTILNNSYNSDPPAVPEQNRRVRIADFQSVMVVEPTGASSCNLSMLYFEDPRAAIPAFVVNWFTATAIPSIVRKTIDAAARYPPDRLSQVLEKVPRLDVTHLLCDSTSSPSSCFPSPVNPSIRQGYASLRSSLYGYMRAS